MREVEPYLSSVRLISLDHDLEGDDDPGDGLIIAKFLAARAPVCPVIIHSSNVQRSTWMMGEFELGGWECRSVAPIGEDWIETYWRAVVSAILKPMRKEP